MKSLPLHIALVLLLLVPARVYAQEPTPPDGARIASAQVSGFDLSRLSPGLQEDITKLTGSPLDGQKLKELAARIEAEQPRYVAALRVTADPDGSARVVFVVARIRDSEHQANINTKYLVENAEIHGVPDSKITPEMRADLQALTGKTLDSELAERLDARLKSELTGYTVSRRTSRGSQPGMIKVIYHLTRTEESRWLRFDPLDANAVYHSDQGWGAKFPLTASGGDFQVIPLFAIDVGDELIEEYSGFGVRFETRKLGTDRLGAFLEWSTYDQTWRDRTVLALPNSPTVPALYRNRMNVTPLVKFAITRRLTLSGGVSITELDDIVEASSDSQMANTGIGALHFNQRWKPGDRVQHDVDASVSLRAGTASLESDLVYERYVGHANYALRSGKHRLFVAGMFGNISGAAPMFERFSLGDSQTLRGWDKYDIAPTGGDRMFHASTEYRYRAFMMFLDSGSVWDRGTARKVRVSTGFGLTPGPVFFTVGFPLNTDEFRAVFTMGVRFSTVAVGARKN